jgi:hypothetical protein
MGRKPKDAGLSIDEMVERYRAGETCRAIAAAAGLSGSAVHDRLKRAGVELRRGVLPGVLAYVEEIDPVEDGTDGDRGPDARGGAPADCP